MKTGVICLLLTLQLFLCSQGKYPVFLGQLRNDDLYLTFQTPLQKDVPTSSDEGYFYQGGGDTNDRLSRYMNRDDGEFIVSSSDWDDFSDTDDQDQ